MNKEKLKTINQYVLVIIVVLFFGLPLFWVILAAFRNPLELFSTPIRYIPQELTIRNFYQTFLYSDFTLLFQNSIIVAIGVIVLNVVASTLSGYAFTRLAIYGQKTFARLILFSYMFPPLVLVIPQFILWHRIQLINTYTGIILAQTAISLPFSVWLMWKYFQTVPISLEESAWIYGAQRFQAFYQIALPQVKPGVVAIIIYSFAVSWNDFTMANILLTDSRMQTLPVGIFTFFSGHAINWGEIMASCFFLILPGLLLVYFLQKYMLEGFKLGGV